MKRLAILGSTGSIGTNALDVVRRLNRGGARTFRVAALSAERSLDSLQAQVAEFRPARAVVGNPAMAEALKAFARRKRIALRVDHGVRGLTALAKAGQYDLLLSAVVGAVGLEPLLAAVEKGKKVALANKEALIVAGGLLTRTARRTGAEILPVDSEHSAIFQCLNGGRRDVRRLILTASGGAFYRRKGSLATVTPAEALDHPTWKMGKKITVDCATLTNKGLEAIEAHHLFNVPMADIDIVVHPQSIVHSLVEYTDGAVLAQLSHPDMRLPIQYALTHPARFPTPLKTLDLASVAKLEFQKPDFGRFPNLALALKAGARGGLWPTAFNGANEVAVSAFLAGRLKFTGIAAVCAGVLKAFQPASGGDARLSGILGADAWSREKAKSLLPKEKS